MSIPEPSMKVPIPIAGQVIDVEMTPEELASYTKAMAAPASRPAAPIPAQTPASAKKTTAKAANGKEPNQEAIREFILGRPGYRHSMREVFQEFAGEVIPAMEVKDGKKVNSTLYGRWMHHARKARETIEKMKNGKFDTEWDGRDHVFVFTGNRGS
jgi:hypothetical protein